MGRQPSNVEQVDLVKARLKATRDRINNLMAQEEQEINQLSAEI